MALKSNFEDANFISSPFVDEVANPGDQRSIARTLRDNEAIKQARRSESLQGDAPKINVRKTILRGLSKLVVPAAERERREKIKNTK